MEHFVREGLKFIDFPYLVRLNPNVPFKTRGNGAVSLHLEVTVDKVEAITDILQSYLNIFSEKHGKSDPTVVIVTDPIDEFRILYERSLREIVSPSLVEKLLESSNAKIIGGEKQRGIVGAAASIGACGISRYTYELVLYRSPKNKYERIGAEDLVKVIDILLRPTIHANIDYEKRRVIAVPHGPDPVIVGLRSTNPILLSSIIKRVAELLSAIIAVIYKTNQGTGQHLLTLKKISHVRAYDSVRVRGRIVENPRILRGGHVIFRLQDLTSELSCAVYRESGKLTRIAKRLRKGDLIEVGGGAVPRIEGLTLNVEYIRVIKPLPILVSENPRCPCCGHKTTSLGKCKGYRCDKCGYRSKTLKKNIKLLPPLLEPGLYFQSPASYRHLSIPFEAFGARSYSVPPYPVFFLWSTPNITSILDELIGDKPHVFKPLTRAPSGI
ncbi:MAG: tRNA(Ile)(2)-agmatinylcytidine synthase [Thermofilaceae archaeon]